MSLLRAHRRPTVDVSQQLHFAPDPKRIEETERARSRQLEHELHEDQRARVEALTASLVTEPDNPFTPSEAPLSPPSAP